MFTSTTAADLPDTGNVREDLEARVLDLVEELSSPEAQAAFPGLLAELRSNPESWNLIRRHFIDADRPSTHTATRPGGNNKDRFPPLT